MAYSASVEVANSGLVMGKDGLMSERIFEGETGSSIVERAEVDNCLDVLGASDVACDISRTMSGRICFPSELV